MHLLEGKLNSNIKLLTLRHQLHIIVLLLPDFTTCSCPLSTGLVTLLSPFLTLCALKAQMCLFSVISQLAKKSVKSLCTLPNNYAKQIKLSPTSGALCLSVSVNVDSTGPAQPENTKKNGNGLRCLKLGGRLS